MPQFNLLRVDLGINLVVIRLDISLLKTHDFCQELKHQLNTKDVNSKAEPGHQSFNMYFN